MLKQFDIRNLRFDALAAASARLCVETYSASGTPFIADMQPPPRGCVLKPAHGLRAVGIYRAAASARLCVETIRS